MLTVGTYIFVNLFFFDSVILNNSFDKGEEVVRTYNNELLTGENLLCSYNDKLNGEDCGYIVKNLGKIEIPPYEIDGKKVYFEEMTFKEGYKKSSGIYIVQSKSGNKMLLNNEKTVKIFHKKGFKVFSLSTLDEYSKDLFVTKIGTLFTFFAMVFFFWLLFMPKKRLK